MSLTESIVEDAALEWFGDQTRYARTLTPALSQGEREEDGEVVQIRSAQTLIPAFSHGEKEKRDAIRRLNPAIPEEARATIKRYLKVRFVRRLKP